MGNIDDAISISIAIVIVLTVGFVQGQRSEQSLEALSKLVPHHCLIIRDGEQIHLLANDSHLECCPWQSAGRLSRRSIQLRHLALFP
ncbi:hypothetical protein BGW80DRAFT_1292538 [Lactifluus volemus]|nr:hypothetical protein BGW80DRAFT_1292538 [Lactifluus volemus]